MALFFYFIIFAGRNEINDIMTDILPILTLPIALLAISVVHASKTQKNEEIRRISSILYTIEIAFPYLWVAGFSFAKVLPFSTVLVFLTVPIAIACTKTMRNSREDAEHLRVDIMSRTATLLLQFVVLLTIGVLVGRFLPAPGVFFN